MLRDCSYIQNDLKAASFFFKKAADYGDAQSAYDYAILAMINDNSTKNTTEAFKYLQFAANHGIPEAKGIFSKYKLENYDFSEIKDDDDDDEIEEELNKLKIKADNGDYNSAFIYGKLLLNKNNSEALKYIKMAADNSNYEASSYLADMYLEGRGVEPNESQCIKYYKIAADNGDAFSMGKYAQILFKKGTLNDSLEAVKYFKRSADLEFEDSCFFYAYLLLKGNYVKKDEKEAVKYLKIGVDNGHSFCLQLYSVLLYDGIGIAKDRAEAIKCFNLAAEKGELLFSIDKLNLGLKTILDNFL